MSSPERSHARQDMLAQLRVDLPAGTVLFEEGDTSRDMFILLDGALEIRKGDEAIATVHERDTYVGEMSILLGEPRSATVVAAEDSVLVRVPPERVRGFFEHSSALALKLCRILARRLAEMNLRHEKALGAARLSSYSAIAQYERLAATPARRRLLQAWTENPGGVMATAEVMRVLDASPAEAGRILSDFRSCGLVRDDNETVAFVRPQDEDLARQLALFGAAEDASK